MLCLKKADLDLRIYVCFRLKNASTTIKIESSLSRTAKSSVKGGAIGGKGGKTVHQKRDIDEGKYELYYKFSVPVRYIKPHQVLCFILNNNSVCDFTEGNKK